MGIFNCFKKKLKNKFTERDLRWNRFIEEICVKETSELSDIQKNAVLCFWYDAEVNNGGHCSYFDCYKNIDKYEVMNAILAVGYKEIADNFEKAIIEGEKDDWSETDNVYYQFSPSLCECLQEYVENYKDLILI